MRLAGVEAAAVAALLGLVLVVQPAQGFSYNQCTALARGCHHRRTHLGGASSCRAVVGREGLLRGAASSSLLSPLPLARDDCSHLSNRRSSSAFLRMASGIAEEAAGGEEPTTFDSVHVVDPASGETSFSVIPPDCWPHGEAPHPDTVRDVLIKPGFGWGEGAHPTTYMCLQFLAEHQGKGKSMMDYGTGSGVLAVAAKRLGAGRVVGVDKDDEILECAEENAELNFGADHGLELVHGRSVVTGTRGIFLADGMSATFDVVVANMLAPALCRLAPSITSGVAEIGTKGKEAGGILALSGMKRDQVKAVKAAYESQGITFFEERALEGAAPGAAWAEWVLLKGRREMMSDEMTAKRAEMLSDLAVEG